MPSTPTPGFGSTELNDSPTRRSYMHWARPWAATLTLIAAVLIARLVYEWFFGAYTLVEDEAHYWEWSRHLEWSYYSKGPGVAWLIRLATEIMGTSEAAIRTPAALASAVTALCVSGMARSITRDGRAGFLAASMVCLIPVYQATSMLLTIDGPYLACWSIAAWAGLVSFRRRGRVSWLVLGTALAIGFLFKYTMVLFVPGLLVFAAAGRSTHRLAPRWWFWALGSCVIALAGLVPVVLWNAQHDWATVHHLLGHVGLPGGDQISAHSQHTIDLVGPLEFIGVQVGVVGPMAVVCVMLMVSLRAKLADETESSEARSEHEDWWYCVWTALPVLVGYAVLSLFTRIEGNWPVAGYITLIPLAAARILSAQDDLKDRTRVWLAHAPSERPRAGLLRRRPESLLQIAWDFTLWYGLIVGLLMLRLDLLSYVPWFGEQHPANRVVARLTEADLRAAHAQKLLVSMKHETGRQPFVIAQQYGRASQLAFYLPGRPTIYAASSLLGGRRTQYDEWEHTDLRSPSVIETLRGRPALLVGAQLEQWQEAFERVTPIGPLEGERKRGRDAYLGYGFTGFPGYKTEQAVPP